MATIQDILIQAHLAGQDLSQICRSLGLNPQHPEVASLLEAFHVEVQNETKNEIIYKDGFWTLERAAESEITQWKLSAEQAGLSITWGWSEMPEDEELLSTVEQFHDYQNRETTEISFHSTFYANLTPTCFRVETGDAEFSLPVNIGYVFFKDLTDMYAL
jgi:hypothetical protein